MLSASFLPSEAAGIPFTHAGTDSGKISFYGKGKAERYDVCMPLEFKDLEKYKIKSIRAYINPEATPSSSSIWIASSLKNQPVIKPEILDEKVVATDGEYAGEKFKVIEYTLSEPVSIDGLPLYVGYSVEVPDVFTEGNKSPLALYDKEVTNGFQFHSSQSVVRWYDYSASLAKVPVIVVELEGDRPENSLLVSTLDSGYAEVGGEAVVNAYVVNTGSASVKSIAYTYTVDGVDAGKGTLEFDPPLAPDMAAANAVKTRFSGFEKLGKSSLSMSVTEVNGVPNAGIGGTAASEIEVLPYLVYRKPLVEEYTGMWCGYCPAGYVSMEAAKERFENDAVLICYHYNDVLSPAGANYPEVSGFPSLKINRMANIDPYFGTHNNFDLGVLRDIEENIGLISEAAIEVDNIEIEGGLLKFDVGVMPVADKDNADYRIGYVITEDNRQEAYYFQENYYSGDSKYAGTAMDYFTKAGSVVTGLVYQDVALNVDKRNGIEGLLPASLKAGQWYSSSFSINLGEILPVKNVDNLAVAVILVDGATGNVINSEKTFYKSNAGVYTIVDTDAEVVSVSYFTLDGRRVMQPVRGVNVVVYRMSDGSVKTIKRLFN